jgi:alkanesulfonate monooxygenase SsuD/methylene tetrahydromethanopterin reductase-like flavin-dependent oxidoreductase (luciferase family)
VRYAAEFNAPFVPATEAGRLFDRVHDVATEAGRDPSSLTMSAAQVVCVGRDEATLRRRADAIGRDLDELRSNGLAGSPAEVVDKIAGFEAAGAERIYLQVLDLADLDHLADVAEGVLPQLP